MTLSIAFDLPLPPGVQPTEFVIVPVVASGEAPRTAVLWPDPEAEAPIEGWWVGVVPSLPGVVSQGANREDVLENLREAMEVFLVVAREYGDSILPPDWE